MKISSYLRAFPYDDNHVAVFSFLTTALALLEKGVWEKAKRGALPSSEQDALMKMGFVVRDIGEEKDSVLGLIHRRNSASRMLTFVVVLNLDCNLSCVYCYENGLKGRLHYMDERTADLLVKFMVGRLSPHVDTIHVDFYGGEPLLSPGLIRHISQRVREQARQNDAEYSFSLVTNGTLLTGRVLDELVPLGLTAARITIDGPRENHDRHRPFSSGAGSFDAIVNNIRRAVDKIHVGIGGNYRRSNYRRFPQLLDFLIAEGITPDKISNVKFDPVVPPEKRPSADFNEGCLSSDEPWVAEASTFLRGEILKRGFRTFGVSPSACVLHNRSHFVVNYNGDLYKCPGFLGKDEYKTGSVDGGPSGHDDIYDIAAWRNDQCQDCMYLPLCFGGCKYLKLLRDGDTAGVECRKSFFDATLDRFIKQDVMHRLGDV